MNEKATTLRKAEEAIEAKYQEWLTPSLGTIMTAGTGQPKFTDTKERRLEFYRQLAISHELAIPKIREKTIKKNNKTSYHNQHFLY